MKKNPTLPGVHNLQQYVRAEKCKEGLIMYSPINKLLFVALWLAHHSPTRVELHTFLHSTVSCGKYTIHTFSNNKTMLTINYQSSLHIGLSINLQTKPHYSKSKEGTELNEGNSAAPRIDKAMIKGQECVCVCLRVES